MAGRKSDIPFEKVSLNLGLGDFARMGELFPRLGPGIAIRTLVRNYIRQIEASAAPIDIDLNPETVTELLDDERDPGTDQPTAG